jgi:cell division protein FtsB
MQFYTQMCLVTAESRSDVGDAMAFGRMVRRRLRGVAAPAAFLALVGYFLWSATQGDRGLEASPQRRQELQAALAEQAQAQQEVLVWERRIAGLRTRIDTDALDERSRAMLNLSDPADVIVPYDKGQRLF